MNERIFELIEIAPKIFFGVNNQNIEILQHHFVTLKIVARGREIKIYGEPQPMDEFTVVFDKLIDYFKNKTLPNAKDIRNIVKGESVFVENNTTQSIILHSDKGTPIRAKTENQHRLIKAIESNDMVFALGPAGTGKTYTSVALAVRALKNRQVKRIILTRPAVEAGENLGFLPGDLKEKMDPYMQPLYDALYDMLSAEKLKEYLENRTIEIAPMAFMRGRTLDKAFVILDEAQNATSSQMKMFLTRMGKTAKFIVTGDPGQVDLPIRIKSGLTQAALILSNVKGIEIIHLDQKDNVRHPIVEQIIQAYKKNDNTSN